MKKHLGLLFRCAISIGILAFIFNNIFKKVSPEHPWQEGPAMLWSTLMSTDLLWLLGAIACFGAICLVNIIRWQIILRVQHIELSLWRTTELFFIGHFFNSFMLGATGGDLIKAYYAAQETHHKKAEAVMTVIIDRLMGLLGLFAVATVMMLINLQMLFGNEQLKPMAIIVMSILAMLLFGLFIGFWPGLGEFLHRWRDRIFGSDTVGKSLQTFLSSDRLIRWRDRFAALRANIKKMIGAYQAYAHHKPALIKTFLLALVTHLSLILCFICLGKSLGITVTLDYYFVMVPAITCLAAIPISIGGLGVREALFIAAFMIGGAPREKALLLSLLSFAVSLLWSMVGAAIYLTFERVNVAAIDSDEE